MGFSICFRGIELKFFVMMEIFVLFELFFEFVEAVVGSVGKDAMSRLNG